MDTNKGAAMTITHTPLADTLTKSARDLFKIAVNVAGFDAQELLLMTYRLQHGRDARASSATVAKAMDAIRNGPPHVDCGMDDALAAAMIRARLARVEAA